MSWQCTDLLNKYDFRYKTAVNEVLFDSEKNLA
jgi:hypothetical protein